MAGYHRPPADRPRELAAYVVLVLEDLRGRAGPTRVRRRLRRRFDAIPW